MKKNFKLMCAVAMAALVTFGCSKDEKGPDSGELGRVKVTVSGYTEPGTRAEGAEVVDNTEVNFNGGYLYFVSSANLIVKKTQITTGVTAGSYDPTTETVDMSALATGEDITNVPGSASTVYIIGNVPAASAPGVNASVSDINNLSVTVASQANVSTAGVENVSLYGKGTINDTDPTDIKASVDVYAVSGRLEIGEIAATGNVIEKFQVDGIFINNYYSAIGLGGSAASTALVDNGSDGDDYIGDGTGKYTVATSGVLFDWNASGLGAGQVDVSASETVTPTTSGDVWAYNLLAPTAIGGGGTPEAPRVVIRLSNIKSTANSTLENATWFLTLNLKFSGQSEQYFKPGVVYTISKVEYDETNITTDPEQEDIDVNVTATLMTWTTQGIGYEFGN